MYMSCNSFKTIWKNKEKMIWHMWILVVHIISLKPIWEILREKLIREKSAIYIWWFWDLDIKNLLPLNLANLWVISYLFQKYISEIMMLVNTSWKNLQNYHMILFAIFLFHHSTAVHEDKIALGQCALWCCSWYNPYSSVQYKLNCLHR